MSQPQAYNRTKDFTEDFGNETDHAALNAELDAAGNSINDIRTNLAILQADDGRLRPGVITADSLDESLTNDLTQNVIPRAEDAAEAAEAAAASIIGAQQTCTDAAASAAASAAIASQFAEGAVQGQLNADWTATEGIPRILNKPTTIAGFGISDAAPISHVNDDDNPHGVTKAQVGLGNVDNTSDMDKPVSTAQAAALATKTEVNNALAAKANDTSVIHKTGNETKAGTLTFTSPPVVPAPTEDMHPATKKYVDDKAGISGQLHPATLKATPVDADELALLDSAAEFVLRRLTWANLKVALASVFSGIDLLDTVATTTGTSVSTDTLDLSDYKEILVVMDNVGTISTGGELYFDGQLIAAQTTSNANGMTGEVKLNLATGCFTSKYGTDPGTAGFSSSASLRVGRCSYRSDTTVLTFTSNYAFDEGQILVYGFR